MKVILSDVWMKKVQGMLSGESLEVFNRNHRYFTQEEESKGKTKVDISMWTTEELDSLDAFLKIKSDCGDISATRSHNVVLQWKELRNSPDSCAVTRIENVEGVMKKYIGTSKHRYIFQLGKDENLLPWFVDSIKFESADSQHPSRVEVSLVALNCGYGSKGRGSDSQGFTGTSFYLFEGDIRKKTMSQILEGKGYYLETEERMVSYKKEVEKYLRHCDSDGFQMNVFGRANLTSGWSDRGFRTVGQAGRPAKMVIDPPDTVKGVSIMSCKFWDKNEEKLWELPIHPIFEMFDLEEHADYRVHVNNAETYVYNDTVDEKLVLPAKVKLFMTALIEHSKEKFEDIVGGKEGGTIILIEGGPGLGKTLSAEVYSEKMRRPLYKVQSSQLGVDLNTIEKNLKEVLQRSERWGAILLIDEADVYIRARGENIQQNAIVGVFLRVLEYYRGVLFMTTNLGHTVDEAIESRVLARFKFENPSAEDQAKMWKIMSDQNKVGLSYNEIGKIVAFRSNLTGRDIKNILKLSIVMASNAKKPVDLDIIKFVSEFKQSNSK